MKFELSNWLLCVAAAGLMVWTPATLVAQQGTQTQQGTTQQSTTQQRETDIQQPQRRTVNRASADLGRLDEETSGAMVRASELIGMDIKNDQGESVGEIEDLVIDSQQGKIRYAAVTYGGFLGMGDKLFAVPFEAFSAKQDPEDPDDRDDIVLILNVTQQQLEGAQGFDDENWPNFADQTLTSQIDQRYGVQRDRTQQRNTQRQGAQRQNNRGVNVDVNRNGADVEVQRPNR